MALLPLSYLKDVFVSNNAARILWGGTIVLLIITLILAYYKVSGGPSPVALHYNVIVGVDALGDRNRLYFVPLAGFIIAAINAVVSRLLPLRDGFLQIILASGSLLTNLVLLIAMLLLFRVN